MSEPLPGEMRIGEVLKQARARAGLDIRAVEEQTKIRVKYLRALEDEQWEALPNSAYAKGFLRTYSQLLGLDGEALADAYRRQVERGRSDPTFLGDQVLERRRRAPSEQSGPRWPAIALAAAVLVAGGLLALGLLGGDEEEPERRDRGVAEQRRGAANQPQREREREPGAGTVQLAIEVIEPVEVCLLGGGGQALIDGQVLNAGDEESFERSRFELRFPRGFGADQLRVEVAGKPRRLQSADGPAAYEIVPPRRFAALDRVRQGCP